MASDVPSQTSTIPYHACHVVQVRALAWHGPGNHGNHAATVHHVPQPESVSGVWGVRCIDHAVWQCNGQVLASRTDSGTRTQVKDSAFQG